MFCDCKDLARKLASRETELAALQKQLGYIRADLELLMQHLKLEVNDIPATERKRVIVKLGTHAKKMKEFDAAVASQGNGINCACRGFLTRPGAWHSKHSCS